jgi:nucleotide-binding universal stress UspA family protein
MFTNVLVGVGNDGGADATVLANRLVAPGGTLTLAHIYPGKADVWSTNGSRTEPDEEERIRDVLKRVAESAGVDAEYRWFGSFTPGRGLHELAEATGADLLVVGSSRRGLIGRVLLGDDTRAALNGASCPVAIAPAGYAHGPAPFTEIGVAYNGSPESQHALEVARALATRHAAKLSAFEAVSVPAFALGAAVGIGDALDDLVRAAHGRVAKLGDVEPHAVYGSAAEELALYSAAIDLLVIGSRGYGPVGRLIHGSTAWKLTRSAHCPLLVLTRSGRDHPATAAEPQGVQHAP